MLDVKAKLALKTPEQLRTYIEQDSPVLNGHNKIQNAQTAQYWSLAMTRPNLNKKLCTGNWQARML